MKKCGKILDKAKNGRLIKCGGSYKGKIVLCKECSQETKRGK